MYNLQFKSLVSYQSGLLLLKEPSLNEESELLEKWSVNVESVLLLDSTW